MSKSRFNSEISRWREIPHFAERRPFVGRRVVVLLLLALLLGTADVWGFLALYKNGFAARPEVVNSAAFDSIGRDEPLSGAAEPGIARSGTNTSARIVAVLRWSMNQVSAVEATNPHSAQEARALLNAGRGMICSGMSVLFTDAIQSAGFRARQVYLRRSFASHFDTHATTEVLLDGEWVIFDPTFNVSFAKGEKLLGAREIRESLLRGTARDIEPVFYGEVAYPVRLKAYYLDWLPLYNNVSLLSGTQSWWGKFPPLRYWYGPRMYYLEESSSSPMLAVLGDVYFGIVVLLPVLCIGLVFGAAWWHVADRKRVRRTRDCAPQPHLAGTHPTNHRRAAG